MYNEAPIYVEGTLIDNISDGCSSDKSNSSSFELIDWELFSKKQVVPHATRGFLSKFGLHDSKAERFIVFLVMCEVNIQGYQELGSE